MRLRLTTLYVATICFLAVPGAALAGESDATHRPTMFPWDIIEGSDGDDRLAITATNATGAFVLAGSFKNEIIDGNGGDDIIYTGGGFAEGGVAIPMSGDVIRGGPGSDTIIIGPGTHVISDEPARDRAGDRLALLVDSVGDRATLEGAPPTLGDDRVLILAGGIKTRLLDDYTYISRYAAYSSSCDVGNGFNNDTYHYGATGPLDGVNTVIAYHLDFDQQNRRRLTILVRAFKSDFIAEGRIFAAPIWSAEVRVEAYHDGDFGLIFARVDMDDDATWDAYIADINQATDRLSPTIIAVPDVDGLAVLP